VPATTASITNSRDVEPLLLYTLLDRGPALQPDNLVISKVEGGIHQQTYRDHKARVLRLASSLATWGLKVEDRIATLMWNHGWHYECYNAIPCMGAVLHTLNLRLGPSDLGYIIEHAQDRLIFIDLDLLKLLGEVDPKYMSCVEQLVINTEGASSYTVPPSLSSMKIVEYEAFLSSGTGPIEWPILPETAACGLCYTSGTTGRPKGVPCSQRSTYLHTLLLLGSDAAGISGTHVILPFVPMFHVLSWGFPFAMLTCGTRAVFNSRWMDPQTLLNMMVEFKVSLSTGVPTVWQGVRAAAQAQDLAVLKKKLCLRTLICGGSSPPAEMMRWYLDTLGVEFYQVWGMTEMNPLGSTAQRVAKASDLGKPVDETFKNVMKAGLPAPGVQVRIANPDKMDEDMPPGDAGELLVRGPWIIQEYFRDPAADKFHKGWLITGDVAAIDSEGAIVIADRSKDVIKSGGEWISSIDLENTISAMAGTIASACVVAVPHAKWDERPVAIVTLAEGASKEDLLKRVRDHCSADFAKFQLPDDVLVWDAIPLTSTGKLDKKTVRSKLKEMEYKLPEERTPASKL